MTQTSPRWQFWIDRGGTFTDLVGRRPDGSLVTLKLLSESPAHYRDAALEGMRRLLGLASDAQITADLVESVKMGTTVATNALLERKGERTLLVTTRGFRDALRIADQKRPRLFDRQIVLPELLYSAVIEADERVGADGTCVRPLDAPQLQRELEAAHADGFRACAIVFMHGYRFSEHERAAAELARTVGFTQVSVSHQVNPLPKLIPRGDTSVVDAYLSPILRRYVDQIASEMPGVALYFMQSSGGLTQALRFQGKDAVLSGPAGGVVGMTRTAALGGCTRVIGFDMGGTSTDVTHFDGELERTTETVVAGVRIRAQMMAIHTVAAGGGSIIRHDGARLRVGPESAGAQPGPASYGRGGPLTITDANLLLGRVQPEFFPHVFGAQGDQPLDRALVQQKFEQLARDLSERSQRGLSAEQLAAGCLQIAVSDMANAIKKISVARGYDVTRYTLQCFGGAGGQHACQVADALGMRSVFVHPLAGVLSAYGMGLADQGVLHEAALEQALDEQGLSAASLALLRLRESSSAELALAGFAPAQLRHVERLFLRYQGTDTALPIAPGTLDELQRAFAAAYRARFAFLMPDRALVIESVSVEAVGVGEPLVESPRPAPRHVPLPDATVSIYVGSAFRKAPLYRRERLERGACIDGPAIVADAHATTIVEPGWQVEVSALDHMHITRVHARDERVAVGTDADPVLLEVFNNLFMNIAEQMGLQLQNTASSVNIKERLDFSCALFDHDGNLIANAPHMPVHLGSMSESIKSVIERNRDMQPGDVFALNDPYHGGTHLPDVTVVTPVWDDAAQHVLFYVASRGHHADIGGITPGSMPPFSREIVEEGILLDNVKLVSAGTLRERELLSLLASGPYPARNPRQNLADLQAQIAANEKGVQELRRLVLQFGLETVHAYMRHVQDNAEESVRVAIGRLARARLAHGSFRLQLDNGAEVAVAVTLDPLQRSAVVDFRGSSAQLAGNFNAPRSVTMAAVLYVFRSLVEDDIPLNAGCLKPIELIIEPGSMLDPEPPHAVVAGNVEVSMCVTNALYCALGVLASSQPTMNNFTFGNERHQYYETLAGGSGGGIALPADGEDAHGTIRGFAGTSVVQTHMTNSRLTDPEILELRFPVRLESYAIRHGSGGSGRYPGGSGARRVLRFLQPMTASILSNGRTTRPFGLSGGGAGEPGRNSVVRADGTVESLAHIGSVEMQPGDCFVIETPGGGAYGAPD